MEKKTKKDDPDPKEQEKFPGYPQYPEKEDIYGHGKEEEYPEEGNPGIKDKEKKQESPGEDLDVPGAELDDPEEAVGEEDEENNYYSLGGDEHDDLEEDKGE